MYSTSGRVTSGLSLRFVSVRRSMIFARWYFFTQNLPVFFRCLRQICRTEQQPGGNGGAVRCFQATQIAAIDNFLKSNSSFTHCSPSISVRISSGKCLPLRYVCINILIILHWAENDNTMDNPGDLTNPTLPADKTGPVSVPFGEAAGCGEHVFPENR